MLDAQQDPKRYMRVCVFVCQGVIVVDNMDNGEELQLTDMSSFSYVLL